MTDEEKAEEYATEQMKSYLVLDDYSYGVLKHKITEANLAGLAEGRKEGFDKGYKKATERAYERQQDLTDTYIKDGEKIKELEKENEQLKAFESHWEEIEEDAKAIAKENADLKEIVSRSGYRIAELKHEIDELKALHESDKKATSLLMQKWEAERNVMKAHCKAVDEVNAKMKCCYNCANWNDGDCAKGDAYMFFSADYKCDKWRLAE